MVNVEPEEQCSEEEELELMIEAFLTIAKIRGYTTEEDEEDDE